MAKTPNRQPIAILTGPTAATVGVPVVFDGSQSYDPDHPRLKGWGLIVSSQGRVLSGKGNAPSLLEWTPDAPGTVDVFLEVTDQHDVEGQSAPLVLSVAEPLSVVCPDSITVAAPDANPLSVVYPDPVVTGGHAPVSTTSTPVSGSLFSIGATTVSVVVQDGEGNKVNCSFSVLVTAPPPPPPPPPALLAVTCPPAQEVPSSDGTPVTVTYPPATTTGGTGPIVLTYSKPSGDQFPVGPTNVLVIATSADGQTASCTFLVTVVVQAIGPVIITNFLPTAVVGLLYQTVVVVSGGTAPLVFSIQSGSLPTGLSLNPISGVIAGTPTCAGSSTLVLMATDANGLFDTQAYTLSVVVTGSSPYFDGLIARSDRLYAMPLRSQAELDTYQTGGNWAPVGTVFYDGVVDAMQQFINPTVLVGPSGNPGTGNTPRQKHLPVVIPFGTTFLHTWDSYYEAGFAWVNDTEYFRTYKSYRWDLPSGQPGPPIWISLKHFWKVGALNGHLAQYNATIPSAFFAIAPTTVGSMETIQPQTTFYIEANRWIRTWVYYDAATQRLSVWVADPVQGVVQLINQTPFGFPAQGVVIWRIEYDTSQNQFASQNPLSKLWNRNVVALQALSYGPPQGLLSTQGL